GRIRLGGGVEVVAWKWVSGSEATHLPANHFLKREEDRGFAGARVAENQHRTLNVEHVVGGELTQNRLDDSLLKGWIAFVASLLPQEHGVGPRQDPKRVIW